MASYATKQEYGKFKQYGNYLNLKGYLGHTPKEGGFLMQRLRQLGDPDITLSDLASGPNQPGAHTIAKAAGLDVDFGTGQYGLSPGYGLPDKERTGSLDFTGSKLDRQRREYWDKKKWTADEKMLLGGAQLEQLSREDMARLLSDRNIDVQDFLIEKLGTGLYRSKDQATLQGKRGGSAGISSGAKGAQMHSMRKAIEQYIRSMQTRGRSAEAGTLDYMTAADIAAQERAEQRRQKIR